MTPHLQSHPNMEYYTNICLEAPLKTTNNLDHNSWSPWPSKHAVLPSRLPRSVTHDTQVKFHTHALKLPTWCKYHMPVTLFLTEYTTVHIRQEAELAQEPFWIPQQTGTLFISLKPTTSQLTRQPSLKTMEIQLTKSSHIKSICPSSPIGGRSSFTWSPSQELQEQYSH
jgi:hypothetical protein